MDVAERSIAKRLAWLLVFRATVATALLILTIAADLSDWPLRRISVVLYAVVGGTYLVVFVLGLLLRARVMPVVLCAVHLVMVVASAAVVVGATGGLTSGFSFLYLLAILDAAIIGARPIALVVASASSLAYGGQLALQLYGVIPRQGGAELPPISSFTAAAVLHMAAFYLTALLAGQLAEMLRRASEAASTAQIDLEYTRLLHAGVVDALPMGVVTLRDDGVVQTANASACEILGSKNLVGKPLPDDFRLLLEIEHPRAEVLISVAEQERSVSFVRFRLNETRAKSPVTVVVFDDRTQLRLLEEELQEQRRLASLGRVAAGIAHEIRNPLAAISGSIQLLSSDRDDESREKLQTIVGREVHHLDGLVTEFLEYARPNPPSFIDVDVVEVVREVVASAQHAEMTRETPMELAGVTKATAWADPGQLRQVLWNLVRNAAEASEPGAPVEVHVKNDQDRIEIRVSDRGHGFSDAMLEQAFEPFQTSKTKGTGLGLSIVRQIVEAHGGRVEIESTKDVGSTVSVMLPDARRHHQAAS